VTIWSLDMITDPELDELLRALSDPTRRQLYSQVVAKPGATTAELVAQTGVMTRWGVMKHLAVLRAARLIQTLPAGRRRRHYPERDALAPLRQWLERADGQAAGG
jgi:DNA-binding transcriptional ArsR family regulator